MKIKVTEYCNDFGIELIPENMQEANQLLRMSALTKKQSTTIHTTIRQWGEGHHVTLIQVDKIKKSDSLIISGVQFSQ